MPSSVSIVSIVLFCSDQLWYMRSQHSSARSKVWSCCLEVRLKQSCKGLKNSWKAPCLIDGSMNSGSEKEESPVTISRYAWTANPPAGWQWDLFELDHDSNQRLCLRRNDIHWYTLSKTLLNCPLYWQKFQKRNIFCMDCIERSFRSRSQSITLCIAYPMFNISMYKSADPSRRDWQISYAESKRCRSILILAQNPKSKIRNPKSKIQNPKSKIPKSKIQNPKSKIRNPKSKIQNPNGAVWGRHKKNED